jgi:hypothetical protein
LKRIIYKRALHLCHTNAVKGKIHGIEIDTNKKISC